MANDCSYLCQIASKNKEAVEQFVKALQYKDFKNGYYMCRIFDAQCENGIQCDENGIYFAEVDGYCAWSVEGCMIAETYGKFRGMEYGEPKFHVFRDGKDICYANIGMTASMLCKKLGCGFEVWSKECGNCFQEHFVVNAEGEVVVADTRHWEEGYDTDESGQWTDPNPEKDVGGFSDWGDFMDAYELTVTE